MSYSKSKIGYIEVDANNIRILDGDPIPMTSEEIIGFDEYMVRVLQEEEYDEVCFGYVYYFKYKIILMRENRVLKRWKLKDATCHYHDFIAAPIFLGPRHDKNTPFWREFGWAVIPYEKTEKEP